MKISFLNSLVAVLSILAATACANAHVGLDSQTNNSGPPTQILTIDDVLTNAESLKQEILNTQRMEAYLLVSLSMPRAGLKRLATDAKDAGIPLVFRGVLFDSAQTSKPLLNPESLQPFNFLIELGASVEINPEIFREYSVSEVPALIIRKQKVKDPSASSSLNQSACTDTGSAPSEAAVVLGDVTLGYMLDSLTGRDDVIGDEARNIRSRLGNRM